MLYNQEHDNNLTISWQSIILFLLLFIAQIIIWTKEENSVSVHK